jgi:hypothetical protein
MAAGAPACSSTFIDSLEDLSSVDDGRFSIEFQPIESRSHRGLKDLRKVASAGALQGGAPTNTKPP